MGLSSALFSSVTGLNSTSTAISVIGDNIANVNTPGFKERRTEFADVLGQTISSVGGFSQIGAGSKVTRVSPTFTQGTFEDTGRATDLAIEGRGFFVVDSDQGRFYSRAGIFGFDSAGTLTTPEGLRVQGYGVDATTGQINGTLGDIILNTAVSPPNATEDVNLSVNLDSTEAAIAGGFDPTDADTATLTSNSRSVITVYDSQGNAHAATVWFTKTGNNTWDFTVTLPDPTTGDPIVQGSGASPTGTLAFDTSGVLDVVTPGGGAGYPTAVAMTYPGGVAAGNIEFNFGPALTTAGGTGDATTQFAASFATNSQIQDGYASGTLQSIVIDRAGILSGQYSNGETTQLAQVALANFPNIEGLLSVGNNNLTETRTSGQAIIGGPQSGNFGSIRASALEQSNVDLAAQFVRMIVNQRAFQANTRTISTTNELLGNLVNLGG